MSAATIAIMLIIGLQQANEREFWMVKEKRRIGRRWAGKDGLNGMKRWVKWYEKEGNE